MAKRSKSKVSRKQERQDARPFIHGKGTRSERWAKKCRGKLVYLGSVADDPDGEKAWLKWLDERDDWRAGRVPRPKVDGWTVRDLVNRWLTSKKDLLDAGELAVRTFADYRRLCEIVVPVLGPYRAVADLQPDDFAKLRSTLAKRWGPGRLSGGIVYTKGIFKYGYENGLLDRPMRFGSQFVRPSAKVLRQARNANGERMFKPEQLRSMLRVADTNAKCMLLLGINGALGNTDVAALPIDALDLDNGWLNYPRGKTAIGRKIPLWPETIDAIRAVMANRPKPRPDAVKYVVLKPNGNTYIGDRGGIDVAIVFRNVAADAGVEGRTFYDLRRTFQTVAEDSRDLTAVQAIMGHAAAASDMSAVYRQRISDDRLRAVVDVVHAWLFGDANAMQPIDSGAPAG